MQIFTANLLPNGRSYVVEGGACGFAWIVIKPGNCGFANWLKKNGHAHAAYGGGIQVSVREGGQSMTLKEAYANAFAAEVNRLVTLGVLPKMKSCYADSRMD